ncbi:hypothetical protein [Fluviispira multicolorata]|uniref:DNA-binding domain-containing protein n=1 Tax=Fluviispira multicolorata TaxID=2654512 RepID=A0A833N5B0_9BACT|nr:hypothetical protein [Fluviispira multicolorata]KAB8033189.1 hypothetical protein GCL57_00395 [Fluviispira multicolorata]
MQLEKLKEIQDFFLETTQKNPAEDISAYLCSEIGKALIARTSHRMDAYRTCYFARISNVFPETTFNLASCLFEKSFVANFVVEYFLANPSPLDMYKSLLGFPDFLENYEHIGECPFVPDFMKLCLMREDVLAAENPLEDLFLVGGVDIPKANEIFLQRNHKVITSTWPLYQMYNVARAIEELKDDELKNTCSEKAKEIEEIRIKKFSEIENQPESLLLFKSAQCILEVIFIPKEYIPFIENMSEGKSLEMSIENFDVNDTFDSQKFSSWIALLTQHKALVKGI